ncbi:hypothetical protein D5125_17335 [Magnetovirga frankeli]|uniref:hypothetical protein n=1 Tax=Magnetovirga frankeli TaxID=947516 RepID=UPI0012937E0F|nr:hypothetical protein D5125_17335 [gamma proteobacterium SS-5]
MNNLDYLDLYNLLSKKTTPQFYFPRKGGILDVARSKYATQIALGDFDRSALIDFIKSLSPSDPSVLLNLSVIMARMGFLTEAKLVLNYFPIDVKSSPSLFLRFLISVMHFISNDEKLTLISQFKDATRLQDLDDWSLDVFSKLLAFVGDRDSAKRVTEFLYSRCSACIDIFSFHGYIEFNKTGNISNLEEGIERDLAVNRSSGDKGFCCTLSRIYNNKSQSEVNAEFILKSFQGGEYQAHLLAWHFCHLGMIDEGGDFLCSMDNDYLLLPLKVIALSLIGSTEKANLIMNENFSFEYMDDVIVLGYWFSPDKIISLSELSSSIKNSLTSL